MTGQAITIQTSDMGNVEVKLTQNSNIMKDSLFIEVVGKVDDQGDSLREFTCADMGNNLGASLR
jgi:cob(I)alamin adenosyltransferase